MPTPRFDTEIVPDAIQQVRGIPVGLMPCIFFCKKHPFYFAGSENLCTFVLNLVMSISNGTTVVDRTYQDNNNNLNSKRNDKISVKTTANDKDCRREEL